MTGQMKALSRLVRLGLAILQPAVKAGSLAASWNAREPFSPSAATTGARIREVLDAGVPVVRFPEGTSSDGLEVLPFMPSLLQSAIDTGSPVTPAAILYHAAGCGGHPRN